MSIALRLFNLTALIIVSFSSLLILTKSLHTLFLAFVRAHTNKTLSTGDDVQTRSTTGMYLDEVEFTCDHMFDMFRFMFICNYSIFNDTVDLCSDDLCNNLNEVCCFEQCIEQSVNFVNVAIFNISKIRDAFFEFNDAICHDLRTCLYNIDGTYDDLFNTLYETFVHNERLYNNAVDKCRDAIYATIEDANIGHNLDLLDVLVSDIEQIREAFYNSFGDMFNAIQHTRCCLELVTQEDSDDLEGTELLVVTHESDGETTD